MDSISVTNLAKPQRVRDPRSRRAGYVVGEIRADK
jgi:hypothetical protein